MPTLSCSSESSKSKYLDEIALLKRGKITRDTPRHTYKRGYAGCDSLTKDNDQPITLAELNSRGLRIDDEHIIYCLPENNTHSEVISKSASSRHSAGSTDSSGSSGWSCISSPEDVKEFSVGLPGEKATLKVSSSSHKGQSYELNTGSDVCVLQQSPKNVVLITWKN
ncbi:hypothetical protein GCK32_000536 [Trichostrongylus colubriformis]|uniref:Uncharacterized protein n=1 Tax=Trichostrongylus colubriformis TaxID=6319 RepID=A0AAN8FCX3_TRICO